MTKRFALCLLIALVAAAMVCPAFGGQNEPRYLLFWRAPDQVPALVVMGVICSGSACRVPLSRWKSTFRR
jgi:hypothetical protein